MQQRIGRLTPQPLVGILTGLLAVMTLAIAWVEDPPTFPGAPGVQTSVLAVCLVAVIVLGHRFPIYLPDRTRVYLGTVPLYLAVVLLPPPLAATVVAVGKLAGALAIRSSTGNFLSDIASDVGRWVVIAYAGSLVAHVQVGAHSFYTPLLGAAAALWVGDIISCPLMLSPMSGQPPLKVIVVVVREAGSSEAAHYVVGILGALAAMQALWSLALLLLPTALVYLAFKSAKDMHESARQLLASVVESSPDAILLLHLDGRVILANRQAAALYGHEDPEEMFDRSVVEKIATEERTRAKEDIQKTLTTGTIKDVEYTLLRWDGTSFLAELSWSLITDKRGRSQAITCVARDITQRKHAEWTLQHRALHDALTKLANRTLFHERLHQMLARSQEEDNQFALFLLDLDGFKQVNDTYGHHYGDLLLQEVARRLRWALRDSDTVARLGGDEFAILLPRAVADGARIVASRIEDAIAEPFVVEGRQVDIGISIGISLYPENAEDADTLLHQADVAMYAAKRGRKGHRFYASVDEVPDTPASASYPKVAGAI